MRTFLLTLWDTLTENLLERWHSYQHKRDEELTVEGWKRIWKNRSKRGADK